MAEILAEASCLHPPVPRCKHLIETGGGGGGGSHAWEQKAQLLHLKTESPTHWPHLSE